MNTDQLKTGLEFYNEKTEKLLKLSFTKSVRNRKTGLTISAFRDADGHLVSTSGRRGPRSESIDAFVLTFRFFIQNNEKCSLARMADYYESTQIGSSFKHQFREIRTLTNQFLDAVPDLHIEISGRLMTRREIIEMVIYGNLSHANEKKRAVYQSWTRCDISRDILDYAFVFILSRLTLPIRELRDLNLKVLATLSLPQK